MNERDEGEAFKRARAAALDGPGLSALTVANLSRVTQCGGLRERAALLVALGADTRRLPLSNDIELLELQLLAHRPNMVQNHVTYNGVYATFERPSHSTEAEVGNALALWANVDL